MSWKATAFVAEITKGITRPEKQVLQNLAEYHHNVGDAVWPSVTKLAERCLMTERRVYTHLKNLEQKNFLRRISIRGKKNAYQFVGLDVSASQLPLFSASPTPERCSPLKSTVVTPEIYGSSPLKSTVVTPEIYGSAIRKNGFELEKQQELQRGSSPLNSELFKSQQQVPGCPDCQQQTEEEFGVIGLSATVSDLREAGLSQDEAEAHVQHATRLQTERDRLVNRRYTQDDFDERDWRKLQREVSNMHEARAGCGRPIDEAAFFRLACERAGISTRRGDELYRKMLA